MRVVEGTHGLFHNSMTKQYRKFYLDNDDWNRLVAKAKADGFIGKGFVTRYIEKVARTDIIFTDENIKSFAKLLAQSNLVQKQDALDN